MAPPRPGQSLPPGFGVKSSRGPNDAGVGVQREYDKAIAQREEHPRQAPWGRGRLPESSPTLWQRHPKLTRPAMAWPACRN
jgi:hypothetical protein